MESNGGLVIYFLNFWSASSHSSFHKKISFLRRSWKKEWHLSKHLLTNQLRATAIIISFWTSFVVLGLMRSLVAVICYGFASIPRLVTKCPRNFPKLTQKVYSLYSISVYAFWVSQILWSGPSHGMALFCSLPMIGSNILVIILYYVAPSFFCPKGMTL